MRSWLISVHTRGTRVVGLSVREKDNPEGDFSFFNTERVRRMDFFYCMDEAAHELYQMLKRSVEDEKATSSDSSEKKDGPPRGTWRD